VILRVLGTAAGGGYPQWNCACRMCRRGRAGQDSCPRRLQDSVAVSGDQESWFLLNASPDVAAQIEAAPQLHPGPAPRQTPLRGVLLTDAEIDHASGLLALRQGAALDVYGTQTVLDALDRWLSLRRVMGAFGCARWTPVSTGCSFRLAGGLSARCFPLGGHPPRYAADQDPAALPGEWSVGYRIQDEATGGVAAYAPGVARWTAALEAELNDAECVLMDGTFWSRTEMADAGVGQRTAAEMGHLPVGGTDGSAVRLAGLTAGRRIYVHINNTNPILDEQTEEHARIVAAGLEVGWDRMEVEV
jgi:pyrroloquinoline quinone biosynthesis protein B